MEKRPSILYLGFNRSYTNPTAETELRILGAIANLDYFGPGFCNKDQLALGINKWYEKNKPYDFLIVDSYVFEQDRIREREKPFIGDFIRFNPQDYFKYAQGYQKFFLEQKGNKILIGNWDTFGISEEIIDRLIKSNTLIIDTTGTSLQKSKIDIEKEYGEPCYGNDNWFHFINNYKEKIISIPHTIATSEFDYTPLSGRKNLFSVVGAKYPERINAKKLLPTSNKFLDFANYIKFNLRLKFIKSMSYGQLINLKHKYLSLISDSKLCYTSGGPWLYPVRKYFEIPARGAVPIGWHCNGFENLGFVDKENFLVAKSNDELQYILNNYSDDEFQSIASAGRNLIWEKHSEWARSLQIKDSLYKILNGNFNGSYWEKGEYKHFLEKEVLV